MEKRWIKIRGAYVDSPPEVPRISRVFKGVGADQHDVEGHPTRPHICKLLSRSHANTQPPKNKNRGESINGNKISGS